MRRAPATLALTLAAFTWSQSVLAQADNPITGTVDAVTVYRGQALVSRLVDVPAGGSDEPREVVVTSLPERILPGSIYAEPVEGVEVRSVRYRVRPVSEDVREEVRKLDAQVEAVSKAIAANARQAQVVAERKQYLDKLESFSAPTANVELTQGVLNADTLKALTMFVFEQRQAIATDELKLTDERDALQRQLNLLQRQRNEMTGGSARTVREAVVFVNPTADRGGRIRVRYLVDGATWSPSYNVRAAADRKNVTVEYNAAVEQMSGEDWSNVTMTLSTATPSLVAAAPKLDALAINLVSAEVANALPQSRSDYVRAKDSLAAKRQAAEASRNVYDYAGAQDQMARQAPGSEAAFPNELDADRRLNRVADELQKLELAAGPVNGEGRLVASSKPLRPHGVDDQSVSATYELPNRTSLPSRSDRQLIQVASLPMDGAFYKLAVPVLTPSVYEEAAVVNRGNLVLLAGPVSSYLGGQFVGSGQVPTVAVGESFTVGFGIDPSLRAGRELVAKTDTQQGGNKVLNFEYRLTVENFGTDAANVRLVDRIPTTKSDEAIRITRGQPTAELSKDEAYTDADRKNGILRWDVDAPAGATGPKAVVVNHTYRIEHDRQMSIGDLAAGQ
ncbi:MAG TPA: DUF4139 domain-containing protein [Tepidisphaeraceae bacterium]|nr:DUF4139 domain-containing protein [Tepidisphaeraceae bacterium]